MEKAVNSRVKSLGFSNCVYCNNLVSAESTHCTSCKRKRVVRTPQVCKADPEDDTVDGFRQALHCQRTLDASSNRINVYFEQLRNEGVKHLGSSRWQMVEDAMRLCRHKAVVEVRQVLMKYLELWKTFETKSGQWQSCVSRAESKVKIYQDRVADLVASLEEVKSIKDQQQYGVQLMQQYWEREKQLLRKEWEAENAQDHHEKVVKLVEEMDTREKALVKKMLEQKKAEIRQVETTLASRNRAQLELMAGNIALSCKTKMERQVLASYDEIQRRNKAVCEEQVKTLERNAAEIKQLRLELEEKNNIIKEKSEQVLKEHSKSIQRENDIRDGYEKQLSAERTQTATLRRQLDHLHQKQIYRDVTK